ncbi:MAG TPA: glycoside hydrolase family 130 protein [Bryobacteraceae bacterium]|nr:glycoside hydrolase family 130 protein [Bryobacteraceae bacterium]
MKRCLLLLLSFAVYAAELNITATRISDHPLIAPGSGWMELGTFNPAAIQVGSKTVLLFRAQDAKGTSRIGYAESPDGLRFTVRPEPVLSPEAPYEKDGGVEDPRLVQINSTYYLTYTGYDTHSAQLCLATSNDLIHWTRKGVILPANKGTWNEKWTKSGAIIPQQVNGKWWMYYLGTKKDSDGKERDYMGLAESRDLLHWRDATATPVLSRRPGEFDSRVMEPGPAPLITSAGILLLYNGADENLVYGPGWVLFDKNDPRHVIARADKPILLPMLPWEKIGSVANVIFLEGAVGPQWTFTTPAAGTIALTGYYGAADKYIGAARIEVRLPHS